MESKRLTPISCSTFPRVMFAHPLFSLWPPEGRFPASKSNCWCIIVEFCTTEEFCFTLAQLSVQRKVPDIWSALNCSKNGWVLPRAVCFYRPQNRKTFFFLLQPLHFGNMRRRWTHSWPAHQLWCTQLSGLHRPRLRSQMADSAFIMSRFHRLFFFLLFWCCCFWILHF